MATRREQLAFAVVKPFGTNAIPHLARGITGQRHMMPAGEDSSAVLNVPWGRTNAAAAGVLGWRYRDTVRSDTLAVALAPWLASFWGEDRGVPAARTLAHP